MIQLFHAPELPPDVPGMIVTDGDDTALLLNPAHMKDGGSSLVRQVTNALLAEADSLRRELRAAV